MIDADRPFVDRPITDPAQAAHAALLAGQRWGIEVDTDRPLRLGMNALYAAGQVVVRVGHTTAPVQAGVALADVLLEHRVPIVPPVAGMTLEVDDVGVTGWQRVRETRQAIRWEQIGAAVRRVHELAPSAIPGDYPVPSPRVFEWWQLDRIFAQAASQLDVDAAAGLGRLLDRYRDELDAIDTEQVVCHGDVHQHNVLSSAAGPLLIDWDLMSWAHPAWDHAPLLAAVDRWGLDRRVYDAFAAGYGRSYADDPVAIMIASLRNAVSTLLLARAVDAGTGNRDELEIRLRYWRGEASPPLFTAQ